MALWSVPLKVRPIALWSMDDRMLAGVAVVGVTAGLLV
jgi:hypothetical protein